MPTASDTLGLSMIISGTISAVGSLAVIVTYLTFSDLRRLRYVELVFYVSLNDFIASVGIAMGPSPSLSPECFYQGFTSNYNFISSVLWTVVISYQVWLIVFRSTVIKKMIGFHCLCWGFTLLLSLLPLITNTYTNPDDESTWCFVGDRSDSPSWGQLLWIVVSFYFVIWGSVAVNLGMLITIAMRLQRMNVISDLMRSTLYKLAPYPLITIICWSVNGAMNIYYSSNNIQFDTGSETSQNIYVMGFVLAISQGFLNAVAFFSTNALVRSRWKEFFLNLLFCNCRYLCSSSGNDGSGAADYGDDIVMKQAQFRGTASKKPRRSTQPGEQSIVSMDGTNSIVSMTDESNPLRMRAQDEVDYITEPSLFEAIMSRFSRISEGAIERESELSSTAAHSVEMSPQQRQQQQQRQVGSTVTAEDLETRGPEGDSESSVYRSDRDSDWWRRSSVANLNSAHTSVTISIASNPLQG